MEKFSHQPKHTGPCSLRKDGTTTCCDVPSTYAEDSELCRWCGQEVTGVCGMCTRCRTVRAGVEIVELHLYEGGEPRFAEYCPHCRNIALNLNQLSPIPEGAQVRVWTPSGWKRPGTVLTHRTDHTTRKAMAYVEHDDGTLDWHLIETLTLTLAND